VPHLAWIARQGLGKQFLSLVALPDMNVPGTDLGLAGVILGPVRQGLLKAIDGAVILARLGIHFADALPVAGLGLARGYAVEQRLAARLVPRQVVNAADADQFPAALAGQSLGLFQGGAACIRGPLPLDYGHPPAAFGRENSQAETEQQYSCRPRCRPAHTVL